MLMLRISYFLKYFKYWVRTFQWSCFNCSTLGIIFIWTLDRLQTLQQICHLLRSVNLLLLTSKTFELSFVRSNVICYKLLQKQFCPDFTSDGKKLFHLYLRCLASFVLEVVKTRLDFFFDSWPCSFILQIKIMWDFFQPFSTFLFCSCLKQTTKIVLEKYLLMLQ